MRLKEFIQEYGGGGSVSLANTVPDIQNFVKELRTYVPSVRVTSGYRAKAIGKTKKSRHGSGEAVDLGYDIETQRFLYSREGKALMNKYGLGFLDESLSHNLKATGGTDRHFHVGKDSTLVGKHYHGNLNLGDYSFKDTSFVNPLNNVKYNSFSDLVSNAKTMGKTIPYGNISNHSYNDGHNHNHNHENENKSQQNIVANLGQIMGNLPGFMMAQLPEADKQRIAKAELMRIEAEKSKLETENAQNKLEAENKRIMQELQAKQQERDSFMSMVPQANHIVFGGRGNQYTNFLQHS